MFPTLIDLPEDVRNKVCVVLNDRLADLIQLQLQSKQAHWNVKGPNFIALHELFDALAGLLPDHIDTVAERIVALGGVAEGTVTAVSARSHLPTYPIDISAGPDHLKALCRSLSLLGKALRANIDQFASWNDAGSADLVTGLSREIDKQLWFLEAHLQSDR